MTDDTIPSNMPYCSMNKDSLTTPIGPRHSSSGVGSFVIGSFAAIFIVAMVLEAKFSGSFTEFPGWCFAWFIYLMLLILDVVAFGLGIAGLYEQGCKKVFPIMGVILSGIPILGTAIFIASIVFFA